MTTIADDITYRVETLLGGSVTHRERLLIVAFAEVIFGLEQRLYQAEEKAKTRPEWAR